MTVDTGIRIRYNHRSKNHREKYEECRYKSQKNDIKLILRSVYNSVSFKKNFKCFV